MQCTKRRFSKSRDAVDHVLVARLFLLCPLKLVLLESVEKMLQRTIGNENRCRLTRRLVRAGGYRLNRNELDTLFTILQRFELQLDTGRTLEQDVKPWLGTMNRDVERRASFLGFTLSCRQRVPKRLGVPPPVWRARKGRLINLPGVWSVCL
jgi:hypothetical protein